MSTKDITKHELFELYVMKGMTQGECAKYFNCSVNSIGRYLDKYKIPKKPKTSQLIIDMTNEMREILDGALLGDGCLFISNSSINADFEYTSSSYQHVKYVTQLFSPYSNKNIQFYSRIDNRTGIISNIYRFKTLVSPTLTTEQKRWYINKEKHIPEDIKLTPLVCKIWYLGDGSLINYKNVSKRIDICTNCFEKSEIENILLPQLQVFDAKLHYTKNKGQMDNKNYMITIYKQENIKKFLDYIGDCPFEDYSYKWDFKPHERQNYPQYLNEWITLYNKGISQSKIADMYGCHKSTVFRIFKENNVKRENGDQND